MCKALRNVPFMRIWELRKSTITPYARDATLVRVGIIGWQCVWLLRLVSGVAPLHSFGLPIRYGNPLYGMSWVSPSIRLVKGHD